MSTVDVDRVIVCLAQDLPPGDRKLVQAFGRSIVVFNVDGEFVAVDDRCPHHGGPLHHGDISGTWMPSEPGEYKWGMQDCILSCPWHGWEFDLLSGGALWRSDMRLIRFKVTDENGQLVLHDEDPAASAVRPAEQGSS